MGILDSVLNFLSGAPPRFVVDQGTFLRGIVMNRTVRATGEVTPHWGIDIGAPEGTPVHAIMGGTVVLSRPVTGYGNAIGISHDDGQTSSFYGHLSQSMVREGQHVTAQETIGLTGTTAVGPPVRFVNGAPVSGAQATGGNVGARVSPHLHMEISPTPLPMLGRMERRSDPVRWLADRRIAQFARPANIRGDVAVA